MRCNVVRFIAFLIGFIFNSKVHIKLLNIMYIVSSLSYIIKLNVKNRFYVIKNIFFFFFVVIDGTEGTDLEYESQFVFPNAAFVDHNGIYYINGKR